MELESRIAQLPPRRRRRVERLAVLAAAFSAVMTVLVVIMSVATMRIYWGRSAPQVALSAGLALVALVACRVAVVNARTAMQVRRTGNPARVR